MISGSGGAEGLGRRQPGGPGRRVQAGEGGDRDREHEAAPQGLRRDQRGPVPGARHGFRDRGAGQQAGAAAEGAEDDGLGEELGGDVRLAAPRARRRPISARRSRTAMTMTLAMPMPPTSSATAPRPRNSAVDALATASRAVSAAEGWLTAAPPGTCGIGRRPEQGGDLGGRGHVGADVDQARVAVVAEVGRRDREADERGAVDLRCERQRVQDAGDGEPLAADEDAGRCAAKRGDAEATRPPGSRGR